MAKTIGMKIIGTAGSAYGLELVKNQGADYVFNHKDSDYMERIKELYPDGIDLVLEMLANVNLNNDLQILKWKRGRVVVSSRFFILLFKYINSLIFKKKRSLVTEELLK